MKRYLGFALVALLVLSCKGEKIANGTEPAKEKGPAVAKIDGTVITAEDARKEFEMLPPQIQQFFAEQNGMEGLVEELVKKELLYKEAQKRGLGQGADFQKRLEDFRKRLLVELLLEEEIEKKAKVTDKEIKDFYDKNKAEFVMEVPGKGKQSVDFERVKGLIEQRLTSEKQKELFDKYVEALKKTYKVELDKDAIQKAFGNLTEGEPKEESKEESPKEESKPKSK